MGTLHIDGLQLGGGITLDNAQSWIDAGAAKVIVTSYLFPGAKFSLERLQAISKAVGKDRLVVDVSCRRRGSEWIVAMDKWQTMTDMKVGQESLSLLAEYCSEFLVHAADVEGLCKGIDQDLVKGEQAVETEFGLDMESKYHSEMFNINIFHRIILRNSPWRMDFYSNDVCRRR